MGLLKIISPYAQTTEGEARLDSLELSGSNARKLFTVEYDSSAPGATTIEFSLIQGPSGGFAIFPGATHTIFPGNRFTFSVDYDYTVGPGGTASLYCNVPIGTDRTLEPIFGPYTLIGPSTPISFDVLNPDTITKREIGSLMIVDENGDYHIQQAGEKITEDESSFGLVRTNPKLTGNVKITVDSVENIWLNSIDAVKELSDDRFKKYTLSPESSYAVDIKRFFDNGVTPPELVFFLYQADPLYTSTKRSLYQQYDRFYQYGVTELKSKFYDEDFSIFAPLYLKNQVPDYFVIFRTEGAINKFSYDLPFDQWPTELVNQVLDNSKIIKTYSLKADSPIGAYLRNIINHPSRTESDLTVSFQKNGYTTYNGVAYQEGSFAQKGELLYDYYNQENPLSSVEDFITLGFERQKILSSHVINLEFLFDDVEAENYTINRYFGLYVDAVDLANFSLSEAGLQQYSRLIGQTPLPRKGVDGNKISQKSFTQTNESGIRVYAEAASVERFPPIDDQTFTSVADTIAVGATTFDVTLSGNWTYRIEDGDQFDFYTSSGFTASASLLALSYQNDYTTCQFDSSTYSGSLTLSAFATLGSQWKMNFYQDAKFEKFRDQIFDNTYIENQPRFFYIKDNQDNLHSISGTHFTTAAVDDFTQEKVIEIKLKDTTLDLSTLSGFTNIFTQADTKILDTKGRSSASLSFSGYVTPNDYLEVRWTPGLTASGYPLRWRVIANDTGLLPGESWPSYTVANDAEGDYYLSYFHSGDTTIKIETMVKSIQSAFDRFPFKNFEVLAKGNNLYFRSTQDGRESNNAEILYYMNDSGVLSISGVAVKSGSTRFSGGSNRRRTRCKLSNDIAKGILKTEYISTKGSFSLPMMYNVGGETVIYSAYLEEPVYDEDGEKLIDFRGAEDYLVISLADESQEMQITSDKRMTTYNLFKPSFGVLSVLPLRDFDTDFYYSDYTRSYTPELIEYFSRYAQPLRIQRTVGGFYEFDKEVSFDTYPTNTAFLTLAPTGETPPFFNNQLAQFRWNAPGLTAQLFQAPGAIIPQVGTDILLLPGRKQLYFSDGDLSKFKGFLSLSAVVSGDDEERYKILENLWDPKRFTIQLLNSEYDRLTENYLKSLVLKSRVVPYVTKWVSPQGKDIRDNPYRFNYHRSFGNMNFSPSSDRTVADPRFHTHEWPYLDALPYNYPIETYADNAFSYFFENLDFQKYDLSSLKKDWFSEYFTVGYPSEKYLSNGDYVSAKIDPAERYAFFNYREFDDKIYALLRGQILRINEIDDNQNIVSNSTKYDNYRISVIFKQEESNLLEKQDPIEFKTIVNEKWKFIVIVITMRLGNYRIPRGACRYVDLYTLQNYNEVAEYEYSPLYSLLGLQGYTSLIPGDYKLSDSINFSNFSNDISLISNINYYDGLRTSSLFLTDFEEEILPLQEDGNYSSIGGFFVSGSFKNVVYFYPAESIYSPLTIKLSSNQAFFKFSSIPNIVPFIIPYVQTWGDYIFYHEGGGNNAYLGIRNRLSFFEISKVIQGTSDKSIMSYEIYQEDGTVRTTRNFSLEIITPEKLTRIAEYFPVEDNEKPSNLYTNKTIGAVLNIEKDLQTIYRYQGNFSPKFRDVLKFWLREDEEFTSISSQDFLLVNTHMGSELTKFGVLQNQFYNKVANNEVLTISPNSGFKSVYPLVNEISIDKKNLYAWSSTWDQNYYRKYTSISNFAEVKGTEEMTEIKSLLGSKAMKVPKNFDLYQFKLVSASNRKTASRGDINLALYADNELTYQEVGGRAIIQVNLYQRLLREMLGTSTDLRAKTEFLNSISQVPGSFDPSKVEQYTKDYLIKNIVNLYEIGDVKVYILETGDPGVPPRPLVESVSSPTGIVTLSEAELIAKKYVENSSVKVTTIGDLIVQVDYPMDSRYYTSISVGATIKRI